MSKRKSSHEYEDDWSDYKKKDAKKDHKHREEKRLKQAKIDELVHSYKV